MTALQWLQVTAAVGLLYAIAIYSSIKLFF